MATDLILHIAGEASATSTWVAPALGLFGVFVGGLISIGSTIWLEGRREERKVRLIVLAVAAELEAALKILVFRRYVEALTYSLEQARKGNVDPFRARFGDGNLPVSNAAADSAGAFPGAIGVRLSQLLTLVRSIKLDMDDLSDPASPLSNQDADGHAWTFEQLLELLREAIMLCVELVDEVDSHYKTGAKRIWAQWPPTHDAFRQPSAPAAPDAPLEP